MPFSLRAFDLHEMLRCGLELRRALQAMPSDQEAAQVIVRYFYDQCRTTGTNERECVMVRFYRTHPYDALPPDLQAFAAGRLQGAQPHPRMQCLVLAASAGDEPAWNDPRQSRGHRAIPLPSEEIVEQAPMISGLIRALGLDISAVVTPRHASITGLQGKTYNIFHVPEALDSPFIPAQDEFVRPYGIRSVLGFGGVLLSGNLYSVILFSRVPIPQSSADRFRTIALDIKMAVSTLTSPAGTPRPGR